MTGAKETRRDGRKLKRLAAAALGAILAATVGAGVYLAASPAVDLAPAERLSTTVLDRQGRLLRAFTASDGRWRLPAETADVDPRYIDMLIAYEDGRFRSHHGIDFVAGLRAAAQLATHRRIVSGASTLTMQVARLLDGPAPRTIGAKLRQARTAIALERRLTKDQILDVYLRLAPFGGNLEGVRAASLAYLGKEPKRLSVAERALLVAIPQSPAARRPDRDARAAKRARDRVLARAAAAGVISRAEADEARREPVPATRRPFPQLAPHLAEAEAARSPETRVHRLTLDRDKQSALEALAREHAARAGSRQSAAIIAVEHATGEIVALVGSAGHLDSERLGANDMTTAVRSPGSTLKPFIYGLAFDRGIAAPETLIEDRPARFGHYAPSNFDEAFHGTVSIREALALSLNIPAVKVLAEVGPKRLVSRLRRAGVAPRLPENAEPSLAVALGGVGLSLRELTQLYVALARGGEPVPLVHTFGPKGARAPCTSHPTCHRRHNRLMSPAAAWMVADVLKDAPPPASARGQRIAFKTGTSYGYRDAWAVGFDGRHTVAVWVGRADGTPSPGITGHGTAAPLLFDAFARLADRVYSLPGPPRGAGRTRNPDLPLALRRFKEGVPGGSVSGEPAVAIAFPPDKAELETEAGGEGEIVLKAEGGSLPLTWLVDGAPLALARDSREASWIPGGVGFAHITVVDAEGRADKVTVRVRSGEQ